MSIKNILFGFLLLGLGLSLTVSAERAWADPKGGHVNKGASSFAPGHIKQGKSARNVAPGHVKSGKSARDVAPGHLKGK